MPRSRLFNLLCDWLIDWALQLVADCVGLLLAHRHLVVPFVGDRFDCFQIRLACSARCLRLLMGRWLSGLLEARD